MPLCVAATAHTVFFGGEGDGMATLERSSTMIL